MAELLDLRIPQEPGVDHRLKTPISLSPEALEKASTMIVLLAFVYLLVFLTLQTYYDKHLPISPLRT